MIPARAKKKLPLFTFALLMLACHIGDNPEFECKQKIPRVIAYGPSIVEMMYVMGLEEYIVGVSDYCFYPEEAKQLQSIGPIGNIDKEKVILMKPTISLGVGKSEILADISKAVGADFVSLKMDSIPDIIQAPITIGERLNHPELGQRTSEMIEKKLSKYKNSIDSNEKLLVITGFDMDNNQINSVGTGSFLNEIVDLLGGTSVTSDINRPWIKLNPEKIMSLEPDIILILNDDDDTSGRENKLVDIWNKLVPKVKNKKIIVLSGDHLLKSGPRAPEIASDISKALNSGPSND